MESSPNDDGRPERKTPVHLPPRRSFGRSVVVYVTVCTDKRKRILDHDRVHTLLRSAWHRADLWRVGRYVVMPDHIHMFCSPATWDPPTLQRWVQYWKTLVSRRWPWPGDQPIWQKSFWDTQLRTSESYAAKWHYVRHNPVRKGLVSGPDEWPYQGEMIVLEWHD